MNYTDPTGHSFWGAVKDFFGFGSGNKNETTEEKEAREEKEAKQIVVNEVVNQSNLDPCKSSTWDIAGSIVDSLGIETISISPLGGGFTIGAGWDKYCLAAGFNVSLQGTYDLKTGDISITIQAQIVGYDKFYGIFGGVGSQRGMGVSGRPPKKGLSDSEMEVVSAGLGLCGIPGAPQKSGEVSITFDDHSLSGATSGRVGKGSGAYYGAGKAAVFNYTLTW